MTLPAGTRLGPYEVLSTVGKGGMGEVHRVRDTRLDRIVAIKTLSPSLAADPAFRERFEREARTLSGLTHPNVCAIYDIGRDGTTEYLVMEYLEGRTLAELLERGPLPVAEALRIARQIADALIAAHRLAIVHRDLKPANVMIAGAGGSSIAKLLDFGLAKRAAVVAGTMSGGNAPTRAAPLTGAGTILGTIQYMAPEQVEGREADARADVWAFGCVLYEMLTGRRPFDAPTHASVIAAILERQPAAIQLPDARLSPAINRVVAACLEKNPDDRFQSMRDVRRELDWLDEIPTATAIPSRTPKWPFVVTSLKSGEQSHRWPQFLPDGRHFIYMPWSDDTTTRQTMLASLDGGEARSLFTAQSGSASTGDFLVYVSDLPSRLMATTTWTSSGIPESRTCPARARRWLTRPASIAARS